MKYEFLADPDQYLKKHLETHALEQRRDKANFHKTRASELCLKGILCIKITISYLTKS